MGLVHLNNQLCDLKKLIDLLNTKCSYYENMILDLDKDVKRLENEILKFKYYSETDDTASDY